MCIHSLGHHTYIYIYIYIYKEKRKTKYSERDEFIIKEKWTLKCFGFTKPSLGLSDGKTSVTSY